MARNKKIDGNKFEGKEDTKKGNRIIEGRK
jgi:hypothetical protein